MRYPIPSPRIALMLALACPFSPAAADILNDHDSGPLTGLFGLIDSSESATLVGAGRIRVDTIASTASHSIIDIGGGERLALDGETRRVEVNLRFGVSDRLEIGIELPYVWHESGNLDSLIENWHDVFSLPNGARDAQPVDDLQFRYVDNGTDRVNLIRNVSGPGDLRIVGGWQLGETGDRRYALRLGLKLPTGDSDRLLGSGGTDLSIGLAGEYDNWLGQPQLNAYFMGSLVRLGEPDLLADRYREYVGQVGFGVGVAVSNRFELRSQALLRSPVYDSDIEHLGGAAAALTIGANLRFGERWRLSVAVTEDIKVNSAPDVAFQAGLHFNNDR